MQKIVIQGGKSLRGKVVVSGAKNAALPIMAACLLSEETIHLKNVPDLADVRTMAKLLAGMGATVTAGKTHEMQLQCSGINEYIAPYDLVKTMRASILVLGPLLTKYREAYVSLPGGCAIGARPVNVHIDGMRAMGAEITIENGYIHAKAPNGLHGAIIVPEILSVTGTENLIMAAVLAEGTTVIKNAAREPEIIDLCDFLNKLGAKIDGAGTDTLTIEGVKRLNGGEHSIVPDRIEAGTFLVAAVATRGDVDVQNIVPTTLEAVILKLQEAGAEVEVGQNNIRISMRGRPKAVHIRTAPYPGFPTDMQAQFMALNCVAEGTSTIVETIFENRFMHVSELQRLGAQLRIEGNTVVCDGVEHLTGAAVMATDLRASASLVITGLVAEGETVIDRIYHLDRGYEHLEEKFRQLGADITRVAECL